MNMKNPKIDQKWSINPNIDPGLTSLKRFEKTLKVGFISSLFSVRYVNMHKFYIVFSSKS